MKSIAFHIIVILFLTSCLQIENKKKLVKFTIEKNTIIQSNNQDDFENIHGIQIINSGPRGGVYVNSTGTKYRYVLYRIQNVNKTNKPFYLDINFPQNSIFLLPDSIIELNVFLIPEKYYPQEKKDTFNYGLTIEKFFESGDSQKSEFNSMIEPNKQSTFFIGMLFESETVNGNTRALLTVAEHKELCHYPVESTALYNLKNQPLNLIYHISFDATNNYISIPCGQVLINYIQGY